jgi:flagellar biosynthesis protein FlhG
LGTVRTLGKNNAFTISVTSGKGGVGKTLTTVNLAVAARRLGKSVLILDGDLGLANVDVVLGLKARYNIRDVLDGNAPLKDIVVSGPLGIDLIPSGSGISSLTALSTLQKQLILDQIGTFDRAYDLVLIDTGAGISDNVLHFNAAADRRVVVTTPEPHAMTDAYALIKVMAEEQGVKSFDLLVNQTRSPGEGIKVADRIAEVAKRYLQVRVAHLVNVPLDPSVPKSVMQRRAASEESTHTIAGQAWGEAARRLLSVADTGTGKAQAKDSFWLTLLEQDGTRQHARAGF